MDSLLVLFVFLAIVCGCVSVLAMMAVVLACSFADEFADAQIDEDAAGSDSAGAAQPTLETGATQPVGFVPSENIDAQWVGPPGSYAMCVINYFSDDHLFTFAFDIDFAESMLRHVAAMAADEDLPAFAWHDASMISRQIREAASEAAEANMAYPWECFQ